jgi:hypothetical protein
MSQHSRAKSVTLRSHFDRSRNAAAERPATTLDCRRGLHDRETYLKLKMELSAPFFVTDRVQTCSHILRKNGKSVAVAFPLEKTGYRHPNSYAN